MSQRPCWLPSLTTNIILFEKISHTGQSPTVVCDISYKPVRFIADAYQVFLFYL